MRVCMCTELTFDRMTVGKIYAGLLIAENWKAFKANKGASGDGSNTAMVSQATVCSRYSSLYVVVSLSQCGLNVASM